MPRDDETTFLLLVEKMPPAEKFALDAVLRLAHDYPEQLGDLAAHQSKDGLLQVLRKLFEALRHYYGVRT